jgi:hypothetical protein
MFISSNRCFTSFFVILAMNPPRSIISPGIIRNATKSNEPAPYNLSINNWYTINNIDTPNPAINATLDLLMLDV